LASEFRYRDPIIRPGTVVIGVSQSGETADTLSVLRQVKKRGVPTLAITNVRNSTMSREADATFYTSAGPEIGVAATKTFMAQMLVLLVLAGYLGLNSKKFNIEQLSTLFEDVIRLPHLVSLMIGEHSTIGEQVRRIVQSSSDIKGYFFIGRGYSYPIALEAALKLKEIAYDYSEGYAAGELKHGPIAMIDRGIMVVVLAPRDPWRDKTVSNLEEVKARGATILGIGDVDDTDLQSLCHYWIPLPKETQTIDISLLPFVIIPIVQFLSYYRAVLKGTDIDKPRNLAKSVTVE
jgi:glutamine---fructose-6-phosphate transaminase (isomerizing)